MLFDRNENKTEGKICKVSSAFGKHAIISCWVIGVIVIEFNDVLWIPMLPTVNSMNFPVQFAKIPLAFTCETCILSLSHRKMNWTVSLETLLQNPYHSYYSIICIKVHYWIRLYSQYAEFYCNVPWFAICIGPIAWMVVPRVWTKVHSEHYERGATIFCQIFINSILWELCWALCRTTDADHNTHVWI